MVLTHAQLAQLLQQLQRIVIIPHEKPDGDAIGSAMALYHFWLECGQTVNILSPSEYPAFLHFLPHDNKVIIFDNNKEFAKKLLNEATLIVVVDCNAAKRLGNELGTLINDLKVPKIMIDHHLNPEMLVNYMISVPQASSTAELVYDFIDSFNQTQIINPTIATCIYLGLCSDTGRFKFSLTSKVMLLAANLLQKGADFELINEQLFDLNTEDRIRLLGYCLTERMHILKEYSAAYVFVTRTDMERFNYQNGDAEGLVNYPLSIEGVRVSILLMERKDNSVKMSFRSKGDFSVEVMAKEHFNGGGHKNAAGGLSPDNLKKTIKKIQEILPLYMDKLNKANTL